MGVVAIATFYWPNWIGYIAAPVAAPQNHLISSPSGNGGTLTVAPSAASDDGGPRPVVPSGSEDIFSSNTNEEVYYANCNEARAAGAAPIYEGEPGYRRGMDGDNDGIACEPYHPDRWRR